MRLVSRTVPAVALGFAAGLGVGPISALATSARHVWRGNEDWPALTPGYLLALLVTSVPAAVNGAIGAGVASRRGDLGRRPVTILPAALHAAAAVGALAAEPQSAVGFQWYALAFTAVIWSAGRLGQRVGRAFAGVAGREPAGIA